jgi:hypothetical protein
MRFDVVVDAIIVAREHDARSAGALLEGAWLELEPLGTVLLRPVQVLRAFLAHASGDGARAERLVEAVKPFRPREYAWLGARWPEMQAFLGAQALV